MDVRWRSDGYLSVNSPELIFDLVNAKPGTNHSNNPTTINSGELTDKNRLMPVEVRAVVEQ